MNKYKKKQKVIITNPKSWFYKMEFRVTDVSDGGVVLNDHMYFHNSEVSLSEAMANV